MTYQLPLWPRRLQVTATCCLMASTSKRTPDALTAKQLFLSSFPQKLSETEEEKRNGRQKWQKNPNARHMTSPQLEICGKKNHPQERTRHDEKANDDSNDEGISKKPNA